MENTGSVLMVLSLLLFLPQLCKRDPSFSLMFSISNNKISRNDPNEHGVDPQVFLLTPSQVVLAKKMVVLPIGQSVQSAIPGSSSVKPETSMGEPLTQGALTLDRGSRRRKRKGTRKKKTSALAPNRKDEVMVNPPPLGTFRPRDSSTFPKAGNAPDVYWRAIPIEHLRAHPQFKALPHPDEIQTIVNLEDVRQFRQDSWQWEALHAGRCTTSQANAALGFLQPHAAEILSVPSWWQNQCAYTRLRQEPLRTLEDMNRVLCQASHPTRHLASLDEKGGDNKLTFRTDNLTNFLWMPPPSSNASNFTMEYTYELSASELELRRREARKFGKDLNLGRSLSRSWGGIQEATALLVAINYFGKRDRGFVLEETGMCGASHIFNQTTSNGILIGATPDGIMKHSDGRVEVLEVKNHCPFFAPYANKQRITKKSRKALNKFYGVRSSGFDDSKGMVFHCYVPQLQLEMFCVGEACQSAVMVRLTARAGALIVRMRRDDEWISEMLYWLNRFQSDFIDPGIPPSDNFFWTNQSDHRRYEDFVRSTKAKSVRDVEFVARVPFEEVQRMGKDCPLFLD